MKVSDDIELIVKSEFSSTSLNQGKVCLLEF